MAATAPAAVIRAEIPATRTSSAIASQPWPCTRPPSTSPAAPPQIPAVAIRLIRAG